MKIITKRLQCGATLVSLMVGLTISMIVTIATMLVFKNVAFTAMYSRQSASADSLSQSSSMSAGMLLQEAGYGITSPQLGTHLVVITGATLTSNVLSGTAATGTTQAGNAVVWELQPGMVRQCGGLYASASGGLVHLPAVNCTGANTWNTLTWVPVIMVPPPSTSDSDRAIPIIFTIIARNQSCKPFGVTSGSGNVLVSLGANNSNGIRMSVDSCLISFPVTSI